MISKKKLENFFKRRVMQERTELKEVGNTKATKTNEGNKGAEFNTCCSSFQILFNKVNCSSFTSSSFVAFVFQASFNSVLSVSSLFLFPLIVVSYLRHFVIHFDCYYRYVVHNGTKKAINSGIYYEWYGASRYIFWLALISSIISF